MVCSSALILRLLVYANCVFGATRLSSASGANNERFVKAKRMLQAAVKNVEPRLESCTPVKTRRTRRSVPDNNILTRYPRQVAPNLLQTEPSGTDKSAMALYFSGKEALRLKHLNTLYNASSAIDQFTVSIWIRPEGGQHDPVTIIGLEDGCISANESFGWSIGIRTRTASDKDATRSGQLYLSIRTEYSSKPTIISDQRLHYEPNRWLHVTATYDGRGGMALYAQGARVAASGAGTSQRGAVFMSSARDCKRLSLARGTVHAGFYRGAVDELRIWNRSLTHADIIKVYRGVKDKSIAGMIFRESFDDQSEWVSTGDKRPRHVVSDIDVSAQRFYLATPPCGKTVCDDPRVVSSYAHRWQLRQKKTLKYRVINVMNDDGSNPIVTPEQIRYQASALRYAFRPYNISWQLDEVEVRNTSLRARTVLLRCEPSKVGNGQCNPECKHKITGRDGGDCDLLKIYCNEDQKGDGKCDLECNRAYNDWDGGDCCRNPQLGESNTCYQPTSPHRAYISVEEYKELLGFSAKTHLNVYFGQWADDEGPIGLATFPWEKEVHSVLGGVMVKASKFGREGNTNSLVHELGHALGLWHVFHGVSEMECTDPCLETKPSLQLGDLCADTNPTPKNHLCGDPEARDRTCGLGIFRNTPFKNYMAYTDDDCSDHFSDHQMARMHCYIDMVYQSNQKDKRPTPLPATPRVLSADVHSVSISWIPPLGTAGIARGSICDNCQRDSSLLQYADKAWSPNNTKSYGYWATSQATGAPDAEECYASPNAWTPPLFDCYIGCLLDMSFKYPVIPRRLSLWVVWHVDDAITDIRLIYDDNSEHSLGRPPIHCDVPFTTRLHVDKILRKVRVYLSGPFVSIDAVAVQSDVRHPKCQRCKTLKYAVQRQPPFPMEIGSDTIEQAIVREELFVDRTVKLAETYTYRVKPLFGGRHVESSSPLVYTHGGPFCGDGKVQRELGEQCDDGNIADGDGCNSNCLIEEEFHCKGEPSLCYIHNDDGLCEDFEKKKNSVTDCGFFTPKGFDDQAAVNAIADSEFQREECPSELAVGLPPVNFKCEADFDGTTAWFPCGHFNMEDDYWIRLEYKRPVVASAVFIYFASDGTSDADMRAKTIQVASIDTENVTRPLGELELGVFCRGRNPVSLNITHDLNQPFYKTKAIQLSFRSHHIAISAVVLRSPSTLDPLAVSTCANQLVPLYNLRTRQCTQYQCERPKCPAFSVKYGATSCSGQLEGDECTVVCEKGYTLQWVHKKTVMCVGGNWQGALKCAPVDCGKPFVPNANVHCPAGTRLGESCRFECTAFARQQGSGHMIICEKSGLWSVPEANCRVVCHGSPRVNNATLLSTKRCRRSAEHGVGTVCRLKCHSGFYVSDSKSFKRQSMRQTCTAAGVWRGAVCRRIKCSPIDTMYEGLYVCTDKTWAKSKCTAKCVQPEHVSSTIVCQSNGQWDSQFTPCVAPSGLCPAAPISDTVLYQCDDMKAGAVCPITCRDQQREPMIADTATSKWAKSKSLVSIKFVVCTYGLQWYPDVSNIVCVQKCIMKSVGDGYCDAHNNRKICDWDGGDCCASTVHGGVVKKSPVSCADDCTCRDPDAAEHKRTSRMRAHLRHYHANRG